MSVLFTLDGDYKTRTDPDAAEIVPPVLLPTVSITSNTVIRGKIAGKTSKSEGQGRARLQLVVAARDWLPSHSYAVGDMVSNDTLKQYLCTAAGISASSGGPTGEGSGISDGAVTWQHISSAPAVFDTRDIDLNEPDSVNAFWSFEFEIHMRVARQTGVSVRQWHPTVLAHGRVVSPVLPGGSWNPSDGPAPLVLQSSENNVLHVLYTQELGSSSITARCYVLEVL